MDFLEPDDVPLSVHEDILKYLKEQDLLDAEDEGFVQNITNFTELQIREILEALLQKFERNQKLKEDYAERVKAHNQYPLFTFTDLLPDFEIDDEMVNALTFRETLIINRLMGDKEVAPEPVGGLCLDIQQAPGKPPQERIHSNIESRLARIFRTDENVEVVQMDDIKVQDTKSAEPELKTPNLEDPLEVQSSRSLSKFLVHLSSQFDLDGYNAGSTITTWVDQHLHTLEEARREFYTAVDAKGAAQSETIVDAPPESSNRISKPSSDRMPKKLLTKDSSNKSERKSVNTEYKSDRLSKGINETPQKISKGNDGRTSKSEQAPEQVSSNKLDERGSKSKTPRRRSTRNNSGTKQSRKSSGTTNARSSRNGSKMASEQLGKPENESPADKEKKEDVDQDTPAKTKIVEKNLYVGLLNKFYYVKHTSSEENLDNRKFYSLHKAKDYISEGANFILQRYLAKTIYIGNFELSTMYINGDMCRNIYNCTGPEGEIINDRPIDVCKIYRTIIEECGIEHKCTTVLTLQGQIVHQTWEGTDYTLQINPLLDVSNYKPAGNEQILLKHAWESDMQLMSKYLDTKIENDIKIKSYMIDHPEFRNMISDYIHTILLLKPEDIIEFTISHFLSFAPQFLPQNDYFSTY